MHKVVLDTNVLVSALWSEQGNPYRILEMFFNSEIALYYNYDTAKASGAILVTGNKKHYPEESIILSPAGFLKNLEP